MRVLVADRLSEDALDEMRGLGVEVEYEPRITGVELPSRLEGVNVLVVRGTAVTAGSKRTRVSGGVTAYEESRVTRDPIP